VKAKKTGDIEAIKAEIAENIAALSPFWAWFLPRFGFWEKRACLR